MDWLDLVAPSAAILALFGVLGLIVHAIRQARVLRRLEQKLAETGEAADEAPLQRIAELQARHAVSQGPSGRGDGRALRGLAVGATVLVLVVALAGGAWFLFVRGENGAAADAGGGPATTEASSPATTDNPEEPVDDTIVPEDVEPLPDKTSHSVAVFNASGVAGAAEERRDYLAEIEGYRVPIFDDAPDGSDDRSESVVMWTKGNQLVAQNVAHDLGIRRAPPIDGLTSEQLHGADVAVMIGRDIANGGAPAQP